MPHGRRSSPTRPSSPAPAPPRPSAVSRRPGVAVIAPCRPADVAQGAVRVLQGGSGRTRCGRKCSLPAGPGNGIILHWFRSRKCGPAPITLASDMPFTTGTADQPVRPPVPGPGIWRFSPHRRPSRRSAVPGCHAGRVTVPGPYVLPVDSNECIALIVRKGQPSGAGVPLGAGLLAQPLRIGPGVIRVGFHGPGRARANTSASAETGDHLRNWRAREIAIPGKGQNQPPAQP
jgi:hypothetical protein